MVSEKAAIEEDVQLPKEEDEQLPSYELIVVISPGLTQEEVEAAVDNISKYITGKGGTVADVENWGKRKLAYPIRNFVEGNYVLSRFKMKPAFNRELEANLRISEDVLRHLLVRIER